MRVSTDSIHHSVCTPTLFSGWSKRLNQCALVCCVYTTCCPSSFFTTVVCSLKEDLEEAKAEGLIH